MSDVFIDPSFAEYYSKFPLTLIDVGASGGIAGEWACAKKYIQVIAFEPDERAYQDLIKDQKDHNIKYVNKAILNESKTVDFYLMKKQETSSIFLPNTDFLRQFPELSRFDVIKTVKMEVDSLDNIMRDKGIKDADFIKLDTQGGELSILEGAKKALEGPVFGLDVEVYFSEVYIGAPFFGDIDSFLKKYGFSLFDVNPYWWKRESGKNYGRPKGQIITGDALYLRDIGTFIRIVKKEQDHAARKSKILKAVSICLIYGYFDYACELMETALSENIIDVNDLNLFKNNAENSTSIFMNVRDFKGKGRTSRILYDLYRIFEKNYNGWATSVFKRGNL